MDLASLNAPLPKPWLNIQSQTLTSETLTTDILIANTVDFKTIEANSLTLVEQVSVPNPAVGSQTVFVNSGNNMLTTQDGFGNSVQYVPNPASGDILIGSNAPGASIAIGPNSSAPANNGSIALGGAIANGPAPQIAIGPGAVTGPGGSFNIAMGRNVLCLGNAGIAIGQTCSANGNNAICLGSAGNCPATFSIALGSSAGTTAGGTNQIAIGRQAAVLSTTGSGIAIGHQAGVLLGADNSVAIGDGSSCATGNAVAIGLAAAVSGGEGVAVGHNAAASNNSGVALGSGANASGGNAIAIGSLVVSSQPSSVAIGGSSSATNNNAMALGQGATNANADTCVIGGPWITDIEPGNASLCDLGTPIAPFKSCWLRDAALASSCHYSQYGDVTVTNTVAETSLATGAHSGSLVNSAGATPGTIYRYRLGCTWTGTIADTAIFRFKTNGAPLIAITMGPANVVGDAMTIIGNVVLDNAGNAKCDVDYTIDGIQEEIARATSTYNPAIVNTFDVSVQWSAAAVADVLVCNYFYVETLFAQ